MRGDDGAASGMSAAVRTWWILSSGGPRLPNVRRSRGVPLRSCAAQEPLGRNRVEGICAGQAGEHPPGGHDGRYASHDHRRPHRCHGIAFRTSRRGADVLATVTAGDRAGRRNHRAGCSEGVARAGAQPCRAVLRTGDAATGRARAAPAAFGNLTGNLDARWSLMTARCDPGVRAPSRPDRPARGPAAAHCRGSIAFAIVGQAARTGSGTIIDSAALRTRNPSLDPASPVRRRADLLRPAFARPTRRPS